MAVNSKAKGARFERLVALKFKEHGYDARRSVQYCGKSGEAADVINIPHLHLECKAVERLNIQEAMNQAKRDAQNKGLMPVVIHKKNNCDILCTLKFDDFMRLYRAFEMEASSEETT